MKAENRSHFESAGHSQKSLHSAHPHPRPQFRLGGLDGLRAIAAISVLLYHAWPTALPGGFLGVDVFFVLSGFLITGLLAKEKATHGKIRLRRFWLRRVRRLFPAVALVAMVMVPVAALASLDLVSGIRAQVAGTLTFTHNWVMIFSESSYFDSRVPQLLTNMWTLAVEQQFYLLWPLVLLLIPLSNRKSAFLPLLLGALSALEMAYLSWGVDDPSRAYMGTDSHAFSLMFGAALALWLGRVVEPSEERVPDTQSQLRGVISWSGMILLLLLFMVADDEASVTYPWVTLFASFATGAVIQGFVAPVQNVPGMSVTLRKILDCRPLAWLGVRSYGIYLWHWPLLVVFWFLFPGLPEAWMFVLVLLLSVVCAALSFVFVESPMRFDGIIPTLSAWLGLGVSSQGSEGESVAESAAKSVDRQSAQPVLRIRRFVIAALPICFVLACVLAPSHSELTEVQNRPESVVATVEGDRTPSAPASDTKESKAATPDAPAATQAPVPAPSAESEPPQSPAVPGSEVTMIGDSVTEMAAKSLSKRWPDMIVDGKKNRAVPEVPTLLKQYADQGKLRRVVVVAVANNSTMRMSHVDAWLQQIGPDRILVLVTGHGTSGEKYIWGTNSVIREAAQKYPQQIVVAPFDEVIKGHEGDLYRDLVHPRPRGEKFYVQAVEQGLQAAAKLHK